MADVSCLKTIESSCSHVYCHDCVKELFRLAIADESLFPPQCCGQQIPIEAAKRLLPTKLIDEYHEKELEYGIPNKTYCYISTCLAFIPPSLIRNDVATCKICHCKTCSICKGPSHEDEDCPDDKEMEEFLNMAAEKKWQRCYSCRRMVQMARGCNHISMFYLSSGSIQLTV
ncbi:hypothetical protein GGI43DRAFT_49791 [Trichoderma evansii]